jgi:ribonuclease D
MSHSEDSPPQLPPLELRDGLPGVITDVEHLRTFSQRVANANGPIALDAERASGYRYSARAYLVQVRRPGAGTALIDPTTVPDLSDLNVAIGDGEWILHAATQDLACLAEVGMRPSRLFDTEVAARLLGRDKVSLAGLVASELGCTLAKGHGAADWSLRPLTSEQLHYAALDVEPLVELREILAEDLHKHGRWDIAQEEFEYLLDFTPRDKGPDPWRRLSGIHALKQQRQWAMARELWWERDAIAQETDIAPGRILPDAAIVVAVKADPTSVGELLGVKGFHGRGAGRYKSRWWSALERARQLPEDQWPTKVSRSADGNNGPPPPRTWAERDPAAAARLAVAREGVGAVAEDWGVAPEMLLQPDLLRRICWEPPGPAAQEIAHVLRVGHARAWQIELCTPILLTALET